MEWENFRDGQYFKMSKEEMKIIVRLAKIEIPKLNKKIERIKNNPKNEGQAFYSAQIDDVKSDIEFLNEVIEYFN
jgi:hypothetical protein